MINFFRKIRRSLFSAGNFKKYFLYSLGEILLVVVGILIALQVSNWNSNRIDRNSEQELLKELRTEFLQNKEQLETKFDLNETALTTSYQILYLIDHPEDRHMNVDSLLSYSIPVFTFDPLYGVMSQLIEAGKLSLIRNDSLRQMLSNWNGIIVDVKESERDYSQFNRTDFRSYLYENANYRNIIDYRIQNGVITKTLIDQQMEVKRRISTSAMPVNTNELLSSIEFENYLASSISHISYVNTQFKGVMEYIDNVVGTIDQVIEN